MDGFKFHKIAVLCNAECRFLTLNEIVDVQMARMIHLLGNLSK